MALYNNMRPQSLSEVKGQDGVVRIMRDSIGKGKIPNAMLFTGTRGTGKTTMARIVARMVNCENPSADGEPCNECESCKQILNGTSLDVMELDAASNNGVDSVRDMIEQCGYRPYGKKRVVILDEVHMLSTGAFNALLKILEEPPKSVLFVLCTTELQKIPPTILSRCRKIQFNMISDHEIVEKLKLANEKYGVEADEDALHLIAKAAKGSMRDAESIYEPFMEIDKRITGEIVRAELGMSSQERLFGLMDAINEGAPHVATAVIDEVVSKGESLTYLLEDFFHFILDIIAISMTGDVSAGSYSEKCAEYARIFSTERLLDISNAVRKAYEQKGNNLYLAIQGMVISLVTEQSLVSALRAEVDALEARVKVLEERPVPRPANTNQISVDTEYVDPPMDTEYPSDYESGCSDYSQEEAYPCEEGFTEMPEGEASPFSDPSATPECPPSDDELQEQEELRRISQEMGFVVIEDEEEKEAAAEASKTECAEDGAEKEAEAGEGDEDGFFADFARQYGF